VLGAAPVVVGLIVVVGMVVGIVVDGIVVVGVCGVDVDCFMVDVEVEVDGTTVDMRGVGDSTVDVDGCMVDVGIGLTEVVGAVVGCCWFCGVGLSVVVGNEDEVVGEDEVKVVV